ncbi:MAG: DUF2267 domain-containing protein [Hyphomicrobiales bacterium]|nr:DUF2267 domain-containing protein [Hyphomicrobiales bacterium]
MEELISRVSSAAGVDSSTAQSAVGMILGFLQKEGPAGPVGQLMGMIPGAQDAADAASAAAPAAGAGGLMGAVTGMLGGLLGGGGNAAGGVMGLASQLSSTGMSMDQMESAGKAVFAFAQEKGGPGLIGQISSAVPGLSRFM